MAGRHRGQIAPGLDSEDASATATYDFVLDEFQHESPLSQAGFEGDEAVPRRRSGRSTGLIVAAVAVPIVIIAALAMVLSGGGGARGKRHDVPQAIAQTTPGPTPERPTPESHRTKAVFVPPRYSATPTVRKSTPKKSSPHAAQVKPPCPIQWPFAREWCVARGFAPPATG